MTPIDDRLMFSTGYTPETVKRCKRCERVMESTIYELCDVCHEGDLLAVYFKEHELEMLREGRAEMLFDDEEERDRQDTISYCREGF